MNNVLLQPIYAADLPGTFTRHVDVGQDQRAVLYRAGSLSELPPGRRYTVAGVWPTFLGRLDDAWVATMPIGPAPLAATLRIGANDQVVDLTLMLQAQVTNPVAFAGWCMRENTSPQHRNVWLSPYRADQLRTTVVDAIEPAVNSVGARIAARDLTAPEARDAIWNAVQSTLATLAPSWGLDIKPAPGAVTFVTSAAATIARVQRLAELNAQLAEIELDQRMSQAEREAKLADWQRNLQADYGDMAQALPQSAPLVAPQPAPQPAPASESGNGGFSTMLATSPVVTASHPVVKAAPRSAWGQTVAEVSAALSLRASRELKKRATALVGQLTNDQSAPIEAPDEAQPPIYTALNVIRIVLSLILFASTIYFGYRQVNSMSADEQVSYIGQLTGSLVGLVIAVSGLPLIQRRARRKAQQAVVDQVWSVQARQEYDGKVRTQVVRQLQEVTRSAEDARRAVNQPNMNPEASAAISQALKQAHTLLERVTSQQVGIAAYTRLDKPALAEFDRMISQDEAVIRQSREAVDAAAALATTATQTSGVPAGCQLLSAAIQRLEGELNRRTDLFQKS